MNDKVLVISTQDDMSTDEVLSWFSYLNVPFTRINDQDEIKINYIHINNRIVLVEINGEKIDLAGYTKFWYRRGFFNLVDSRRTNLMFKGFLEKELIKVSELLEFYINSSCHINKPSDNYINKLRALSIAHRLGILIPETVIRNSNPQDDDVITKSISELGSQFGVGDVTVFYGKGVHKLRSDDRRNETFFPSLFQNYIEKKYEIRSFYLKGKFKSMAIFSQQNEKTRYDFRNYDNVRPNRCVPYNLPQDLEQRLHKLMVELNINCGSMDIVVDAVGDHYFLEVNPIGQFQWLSKSCNYQIEKLIAEHFLN